MKDPNWEHGLFDGTCDKPDCKERVAHRAFDDYSADADALKSLCAVHYNKSTQKDWLKRKRKSLGLA